MGIDGISGGGGMARLQGLPAPQSAQGTPDIKQMQDVGAKLDQDIKQLGELIKNAIASGADQGAIKALQAQLSQLQQLASSAQGQNDAVGGAQGGGQGGGGGAAALDLAKKIDDIQKQIDQISQSVGLAASNASSAQSQQQQQQQQQNFLGQDQNKVQGRDMMSMY